MATWVGYSLRLDMLHRPEGAQWWVYGITPLLFIPIFVRFGLYRAIFRYTGQAALLATAKAVGVYAALLMAILNLIIWHFFSDSAWVTFKVFGLLGCTLLFALANAPFMAKYIKV